MQRVAALILQVPLLAAHLAILLIEEVIVGHHIPQIVVGVDRFLLTTAGAGPILLTAERGGPTPLTVVGADPILPMIDTDHILPMNVADPFLLIIVTGHTLGLDHLTAGHLLVGMTDHTLLMTHLMTATTEGTVIGPFLGVCHPGQGVQGGDTHQVSLLCGGGAREGDTPQVFPLHPGGGVLAGAILAASLQNVVDFQNMGTRLLAIEAIPKVQV